LITWKSVRSAVALTLALSTALAALPARAGGPWPQPAAGESASGDPEVLFTFDDGPHERDTQPVLDALAAHGVKAIFFLSGWRVKSRGVNGDKRRAALARAVAEGHVVGNHTVNHVHLCAIPTADAAREIDDNQALLTRATGMPVAFLRAPYGDRCRRLESQLAERDMQHLHWDMDASEWETPSAEAMRAYYVDRLRRLRGRAVLLLHDTKYSTRKALPLILTWIGEENARRRARGERPIRILSPADLAREAIPPAVADLVDRSLAAGANFVPDVLGLLVAPLMPLAPAPRPHAVATGESRTPRAFTP
jgi:peptidoglycan/xylan/chitin deacetylase (PgdA/CDA1 family)